MPQKKVLGFSVTVAEGTEAQLSDQWYKQGDLFNKKAVIVTSECADEAPIFADLLKDINKDCYNDDKAELQFLYSKPSCFLVLGKPGVGKTSLARRFANEWKCLIINSTDIIIENMVLQTEIGLKCVDILTRGEAVPDDMVLKMIEDKINSAEVAHHGYILDDFPCLSEDLLSIQDQLEFIKSWKLKPDFIINLRIHEKDIERRRLNQKIDPYTGIIYTKEVYAQDKPIRPLAAEMAATDKEEEASAEEGESVIHDVLDGDEEHVEMLPIDVVKRLVKRTEDMPQQVEENLAKYRKNILRSLEDYMGDHDQQYLVELDGNLSVFSLFKQLEQKLQTFVLRPAALVTRLTDPDDDEISEDMDTDDILRAVCPKQMVAPRFRWRRSKWQSNCPVALYEGNIVLGKPEYAVSFLDKVYCLSSAEALEKFMRNPRPYLVPKQPRTPCKISVIGQPFSGKTTLCYLLAHHFGAKVFNIEELAIKHEKEEKKKRVEQVRITTIEKAILEVKGKIKAQWEAEAELKEKERLSKLAADAEALRLEHERMSLYEDEEGETSEELTHKKKESTEESQVGEETLKSLEDGNDTKSSSDLKDEGRNEEKRSDVDIKKEDEDKEGQEATDDTQEEEEKNEDKLNMEKSKSAIEEQPFASIEETMQIVIPEPEVDETHPEVQAIVNVAVALAEIAAIIISPEFEAELLENTIKDWEKELRSARHDGPLHGCWILDNFPETTEQWNACVERNILPDSIYVLGDDIKSLDPHKLAACCARYCLKNRDIIFAEMNRRGMETELKNHEARIEAERKKIYEEERKKKALEDEKERQRLLEEEARAAEEARQMALEREHDETTAETLPSDDEYRAAATPVQVPSNVLDDDSNKEEEDVYEENEAETIREKSELEMLMEQPEALAFMAKLQQYDTAMNALLATIIGTSSVIPFKIAFSDSTIELVFETVVQNEDKVFRYLAWEVGQVDLDEIDEDLEADTMDIDHETTDDINKDDGEEEEEDPNRGIKKFLGDSNYFDPVNLKEADVLYPGNPELAAMYREKMYYFSTSDNRDKFIEEPNRFLVLDKPLKAPPLRLLILGPRGAGKTTHGHDLAEQLGIFHISFRERLQELIIAKTKKKIGPEYYEADDESLNEDSGNLTGEKHVTGQLMSHHVNAVEDEDDDDSDDGDEGSQDDDESRTPVSEETEHLLELNYSTVARDSEIRGIRDESTKFQESELGVHESFDTKYISKLASTDEHDEKEEEVELTEDEEAIKANLESNEPLPTALLDSILKSFWTIEPFKSTGFILEGFPRTAEEAKYLQESGLFPDAAILLQVTENNIVGRLLPPKLNLWRSKRAKRLAKRARTKAKAQALRNSAIAKRKEILIKERDEKRSSKKLSPKEIIKEDEDEKDEDEAEGEEEEEEEEEEDIDAILAEEFEEEEEVEEEEEDELEEDAVERMKNEFNEIFSDENDRLSGVMETLEEVLIPCLEVAAGRKPHIVRYIINKKIKPFVDFRDSIFERVYPVTEQLAKRMLQIGYKKPSRFGRWDPVLLKEDSCIQPMSGPDHPSFACIYRSYIYYLSSLQNRITFMQNPVKYLTQESPKPVVPLRIAITGPPKSGKTTLANRLVEDYGVIRLSIGQAMRQVLTQYPYSELAQQMKWNLIRGRVVPDELQIQALDVALLDVRCQIRGYVLDGYPMTLEQIRLMTNHSIIPVRVIELELNSKEVLVRGIKDRLAPTRTAPINDSTQILLIKLSCYQKTVPEVRKWYQTEHQNHTIIAADQSKWYVMDAVNGIASSSIKRIQDYLHRVSHGRAAGIAGLCITPKEFHARIGNFGEYCPVSLAEWCELVDCSSNETLEYAAEFRGHYYKLAGPKELEMFLANPEKYVPPVAPYDLPQLEDLPHRLTKEDLELREPEICGYCPVTYLDGNLRYEALVPGNWQFAVEYKGKVYLMDSEEKLQKFMRQPEKYANLTLPHKLPPAPEDMPLQNLPMLGFMEQTCAIAMIKALTAAGNVKPKYPFISSTRSALIFIAYHLKAFNPKSSPYIRKKYKQKLQQFQETCELIQYLGNNMTGRYRDPSERPKDFDNKLEMFFALKGVEPTPTWLK